jgi:O-antigen/teichoic acid export membrane protein
VTRRGRNPGSLIRNTVAQSLYRLSAYALSFISAPIILDRLGLRMFGIWALTGGLVYYGGLLDLGVGASISRYIAAHSENRRVCGQYLAIGWIAVFGVCGALIPVAAVAAGPLSRWLQGISVADMRVVLVSTVAILCCEMAAGVVTSFPIGLRRMLVPNVAYAIGGVLNFAASVGSLELGARLPGYALANAGAALVTVIVVWIMVTASDGIAPLGRPRWPTARAFLSYSVKSQMVKFTDLINYQTDKIVIGIAIGPAVAGAYELANRVALAVREIAIFATSAVNVELTALVARSGVSSLAPRYERLNTVAAALAFPPVVLAIATAPLLFGAWLSHVPAHAVLVLAALAGAYLLSVSTGVASGVTVAVGQPGVVAKTSMATALANVVLTVALAPAFGIWGVLAGTVVALSVGAVAQVVFIHRHVALPVATYTRAVWPALRTCVALAIPVAAISYASLVRSRAGDAGLLIALVVAYFLAWGVWAVRTERLPATILRYLPRVARLGVQV